MTKYTCKACGVQQSSSHAVPTICPICEDDRQNVPATGQEWLILPEHHNKYQAEWTKIENNVHSLPTSFKCGIGQDAYLIQTQNGNYLWDCVPLVSDEWVDKILAMGGLKAIIISHPHFYSNAACWSAILGNIPIYIHHADKHWVQDMSDNILFWQGDKLHLEDDLTVINCGGHFDGSCVLHWQGADDGQGVLFGADTIYSVNNQATFMHSYPNVIPLPAKTVKTIGERIKGISFNRLYGPFSGHILTDADAIVQHCINRYVKAVS